ncbi:MAG: DMT family transporter [Myxococcales bacterium]
MALLRKDRGAIFKVFVPQKVWRRLVPAMFLGTYVSMLLWLGGVKYTSSTSAASVLNQLSVLFTLVLARVWLKEPMSTRKMLGGASSLAGAIVILLATG